MWIIIWMNNGDKFRIEEDVDDFLDTCLSFDFVKVTKYDWIQVSSISSIEVE